MSYRDELEAAQARTEALERELAEAHREIAELKGESTALVAADRDTALAVAGDKPKPKLVHERVFPGSLDDPALAEVAEFLSESAPGIGPTSELTVMTGSVLWKGVLGSYQQSVRVSSRRGQVTVKMETNIAAMGVGAAFAGMFLSGGASLATAGIAAAAMAPPALGLLPFVPLAWWIKRRLHRRFYRKRSEKLRERFDALIAVVEPLVVGPEDAKNAAAPDAGDGGA